MANALKYTPRGSIDLNLDLVDSMLTISVTDSGVGMGEAQLRGLFKLFDENSVHQSSSGLGLTMCKNLAEAMGGHIHI